MLRASSAEQRTRSDNSRSDTASPAGRGQPGAEKRPGPTQGTSWREVQSVERRESPAASPSATDSTSASDSPEAKPIRIKDLDSGREYNVQQKYTIRDLTTGQLFALCKDGSGDPNAPAANFPEQVTDFTSGKQLSLEEFDIALGLRGKSQAEHNGHSELVADGSSSGKRPSVDGVGSSSSKPLAGKQKGWLKRIHFGKSKAGATATAADTDGSGSESSYGTPQSGPHGALSRNSGAAPLSGHTPVRVHVHRKLHKELAGLALVQSLQAHTGVVWAMKFSQNGKFLATAGQDAIVYVWEVASHRGPKPKQDANAAQGTQSNGHQPVAPPEASSAVFNAGPHRVYRGHKQDVLDVAWSSSLFLLTASMDKTVRLWHVSMDDCLRVFRHTDFVTALDFHPIDDKHFVSGSIDGKVRVWNIPEQSGRVVDYADVHEMVTAATFSPDGARAIVGTMKGKCRFYQLSPGFKLEYEAQIDVKNRRGKTSRGRKITGLQFLPNDSGKLLITSNDSRIRLYNGYTLRCKYKGLHNTNTQIRASFSERGDFIVCGSDDGSVYFWTTSTSGRSGLLDLSRDDGSRQEKSGSFESFHAHDDIATVAIFAPESAKRQLVRTSPSTSEQAASASESMNRLGLRSKFSKEEVLAAAQAGEAAMKSARAHGQVLLTAGYNGEIKVFENLSAPHWL